MKALAITPSMLLVLALVASAQNAPGPSIWSGVFTAEQAKRGDDEYQANCASCHGSDLHATDSEAADLIGPAFQSKWNGTTLQEHFETMRDTMPRANPNSLDAKTYMDILSFILQRNDFPTGNQELTPETSKQIVFAKR